MIHLICSNGTAECACLHLTKMSRCLQLTKQAFLRAYKSTNHQTDLPMYSNICRIQSLVMPPCIVTRMVHNSGLVITTVTLTMTDEPSKQLFALN